MARSVLVALAILLSSAVAHAECDAGCDSGCDSDAAGDSGCSPTSAMQPPDEDDPGGCSCLFSDELPGAVPLSLVLLPPLAWSWRRRGSG